MPAAHGLDFLVQRSNLRTFEVAASTADAEMGEALISVEKFAFTANNVTYAVFGDAMQYWNFFPHAREAVWGRIPVWGYGEVLDSRIPELTDGERIYGYLPMSTHAVLLPAKITPGTFLDGAEHRRKLPAAYQLYHRLANDPLHDPAHEDHRALLHPLFFTSFLIEDFLRDNGLFGATQVVIASASSKTALGVAFQLKKDRGQTANSTITSLTPNSVVGLTSPRNQAFCEKLGYYDQVVAYEDLGALKANTPTVFVDMAGDGKLLHAVHHHFGDALKYSCIVGATHWDQRATQHALPGAKPQFFFAPTQVQKRQKDWGGDVFMRRLGEAWRGFLPSVESWLEIRHSRGAQAVAATYLEVLEGRVPPQVGHVLSLQD